VYPCVGGRASSNLHFLDRLGSRAAAQALPARRHRATVGFVNAPDAGAGVGHAAEGVGGDPPDRARLRRLADEQAALRRVAVLVAGGAGPDEVFSVVADELGRLIGAEATFVSRVDPPSGERGEREGHLTVVGSYGRVSGQVPVGFRMKLQPGMVHTAVLRTGHPARISGERLAAGPFGAIVGTLGLRAAVGTPIVVGGRHWGVTVAATSREDFPAGTESRVADFMELAATAIANAQAGEELRKLADTQAALRRLATLVARGEAPEAVFTAVIEEVGKLLPADFASMCRYEPDGTQTFVATWGRAGKRVCAGSQQTPWGHNLGTLVFQTGGPARIDSYADASGPLSVTARETGLRSAVAAPVNVEGRLWGMMGVGSSQEQPLPPDTEARLASFTELVATAIANAESRAGLARLADEQAALRRVATLVARGAAPEELFAAVAEEAGRLLGAHMAGMARYETDHTVTVLAAWAAEGEQHPLVLGPWPLDGGDLASTVFQTGQSVRIDDYHGVPGRIAAFVRDELGVASSVASPVIVEGRLWGVLFFHSKQTRQPFPGDAGPRLAGFTELVAMAIANIESRVALAASRARIVAAADETRRRIERDLHDGTQQQLVSLMLNVRAAQAAVPPQLGELGGELARIVEQVAGVFDRVREISHGIHPAILSERGLQAALKALARRSAVPVGLDLRTGRRLPGHIEVAAYYAVSEALANAAKHAHASTVHVELDTPDAVVRLAIRDDGIGGADPAKGSGLVGLSDRIEALGGTLQVTSPAGGGTTLLIEIPVECRDIPPAPEP
jgi:signal transduction histidine kinase